jgi:Ca-activated chloride channel family protein
MAEQAQKAERVQAAQEKLAKVVEINGDVVADAPEAKPPPAPPLLHQPEVATAANSDVNFSTFSLNVSDVAFKTAAASLNAGALPDPNSVRVEEFVNAFNYRDPAPARGARLAFAWERTRYPFAHNRDLLRFAVQTAAQGREAAKPLNLVILLDNSGSMERPDRVQIIGDSLKVLAQKLQPQDKISVVAFSRTARLWVDGMAGGKPQELLNVVGGLVPQGGTDLGAGLELAYKTAVKNFMPKGNNRVIMLTDGAANLGDLSPDDLKKKVVQHRQKGIALDCFGIGWEGYNDDLLEVLSHNGDGRYSFLNDPEQAGPEFANQLAGALNVAACDVKAQVEFNPARVTAYRQIGYAKHQLTKQQFRDNTVDAAEIAASESGNALYVIQVNPEGSGPLGVVRVRHKAPDTGEYMEQEWTLPYQPKVPALDQAAAPMRLAAVSAAFGEWLARNPYAGEVNVNALPNYLNGVPEFFSPDPRPKQLALMIRQAMALGEIGRAHV